MMKTAIEKIMVMERIRKEITKIDELAEDIRQNGLLNAVTVMPLEGGELRLLAGLRRIKAAQLLGWTEIEVNVVTPANAEEVLRIEISENVQREPFTFSEKVDFGKLLVEIETEKAKERMLAGKKCETHDPVDVRPQGNRKSRDVIGAKIGMSGRQYDRAKYVAENAPPEVIEQLDNGKCTIFEAYDELKAKEKAGVPIAIDVPTRGKHDSECKENPEAAHNEPTALPSPKSSVHASVTRSPRYNPYLSPQEEEALRKRREFDALPPEGKVAELQRQLKEERVRANGAESDLEREKELRQNDMYHYSGTIEMLKKKLAAAIARIEELEAKHESV